MRGGEAYVYTTNSNDEFGRGETLQSYLLRAADRALAARSMTGPSAASFNHHEVMSRIPFGSRHMPGSGSPFAGVLLRAPDGGSFLLGSSFYSQKSVPESAPVEALHLQTQPHPMLPRSQASRTGSFYLTQQEQGWRSFVPTMHGGYVVPSLQAPAGLSHPAFVAVSG